MAPPVIGITTYIEQARYTTWEVSAALLPYWYVQQVEEAGGLAVLLPPNPGNIDLLDRVDGLLLSGGADMMPEQYQAERHPATTGLRPERDDSELPLARAALRRDLPVLGVCRGMQVLAVATGGTLHQHVPDLTGNTDHRPHVGSFGKHEVRLAAGSRLHALLGERVTVPTHHHQAVADPGSFTVTGWTPDGIAEALEDPERRFALGVQWHPEAGEDPRLFDALVAAAGAAGVAGARRVPGPVSRA